ncbi:MAG TPA: acetyl-coenzyme A synthetase N-terminal domain-containing protein, partial [Woeseiaceae bacterium]|nr:acetyl-coenzyme A synthetase N-terminal domain-containing protein [Woeseiaceae bacterium]
MSKVYPVNDYFRERAYVDEKTYDDMYRRSLADDEAFWAEQAERIDWMQPFTQVKDVSYDADDLHIRWYADGTL